MKSGQSPSFASFVPPLTPVVKWLLIINLSVWIVVQLILENLTSWPITRLFSLVPQQLLMEFQIWKPLTYMFFHSNGVSHILFNMLMLWFFGSELESRWGGKAFLKYYLTTGVGAALLYSLGILAYSLISGHGASLFQPVIGASGAIFGLMIAHGILFSERIVYFFMIFPMKNKYFVMILAAVEVVSLVTAEVTGQNSGVAYLAHIGGLIVGFLYLRLWAMIKESKSNMKKAAKPAQHLKLVVSNDTKKDDKNGPRYWN